MISIEFQKNETAKTIYNVYQWNYGRILNIKGLDLNNDIDVQFSIDRCSSALVEHRIENDALIVPIPNQFLTNGGVIKDFKVYAYVSIVDENSYRTVKNIVINVTGCPKPDDYVYTETEILTYRSLEERVTALEKNGGGSGTQSDWNQNDKNAADYVKNRPFYTEPDGIAYTLEEKTLEFTDLSNEYPYNKGGSGYGHVISDFVYADSNITTDDIVLANGVEYAVVWDGAIYHCIATEGSGMERFVLGNMSLYNSSNFDDTGEPFLIFAEVLYGERGLQIFSNDTTNTTHTLSFGMPEIDKVVQIPKKYIPAYSIHDLKEKPFKERTIIKKVYVEETTINLDSNVVGIDIWGQPIVGEIVTVLFDGKEYATEVYDGWFDGDNAVIAKIEIDTGVFFYVFFDMYCAGVNPADNYIIGGDHTIKVYSVKTAVKLDEKYIDAHDCFFVINLSWDDENETYSVDKTFAEIKEAYENGKEIKLLENNIYIYPLVEYYGDGFYFGSYLGMYNFEVIIWDDDEVDWFEEDDWQRIEEEFVSVPDTVKVGQVLVVKAVDEYGKPIEWSATDMYNKTEIDTIMAEYITDIDTLVGGESE